MHTVTINPSDLTFLLKECPRCLYKKARHRVYRPNTPFPSLFGKITASIKRGIKDQILTKIGPSFPHADVVDVTVEVNSKALPAAKLGIELVFKGQVDVVFSDAEEIDSNGIAKLLTSDLSDEQIADDYWLQMHALLRCVEHPGFGGIPVADVKRMGVIVFNPGEYTIEGGLDGNLRWVEIPIDREEFKNDMRELVKILGAEEDEVTEGDKCEFCKKARVPAIV